MVFETSIGLLKSVLVVAGLGIAGMGGYNLATTGCPLGGCPGEDGAKVATVSSERVTAGGSCCSGAKEAEVVLTASASEAPEAGHCSEAMQAACHAAQECPMMAAGACEMELKNDPEACRAECPHEAPVEQVAETVSESSEKGAG